MGNKIYYGEYSLRHWIELILSKNIELPPYQRVFVWGKEEVQNLIISLENQLYIPPITIGAYFEDNKLHNLIIDGQQRLTSILLTYLGIFPNSRKIKKEIEIIQETDDEEVEEEDFENLLEWRFDSLLEFGKTKEEIIKNKDDLYLNFDISKEENFFDNTYLGFSYIVPQERKDSNSKNQQQYYSSVFREINKQGVVLQKEEIRESLYYYSPGFRVIFKPKKSLLYTLQNRKKMDFVRYLALSSQYAKSKNSSNLTKGYKKNLEDYYSAFVEFITIDKKTNIEFEKISIEKEPLIDKLFDTIERLGFPKNYESIINMDIYFFGIIFFIIFEKNNIDIGKKEDILKEIEKTIKDIKNENHLKSPNAYKYLKTRIYKSLEIWGKYVCK